MAATDAGAGGTASPPAPTRASPALWARPTTRSWAASTSASPSCCSAPRSVARRAGRRGGHGPRQPRRARRATPSSRSSRSPGWAWCSSACSPPCSASPSTSCPLQVGASAVAFPRAAAASFWGWLIGSGPPDRRLRHQRRPRRRSGRGRRCCPRRLDHGDPLAARRRHLRGHHRAVACAPAGMSLRRVPSFSWSMLVAGVDLAAHAAGARRQPAARSTSTPTTAWSPSAVPAGRLAPAALDLRAAGRLRPRHPGAGHRRRRGAGHGSPPRQVPRRLAVRHRRVRCAQLRALGADGVQPRAGRAGRLHRHELPDRAAARWSSSGPGRHPAPGAAPGAAPLSALAVLALLGVLAATRRGGRQRHRSAQPAGHDLG